MNPGFGMNELTLRTNCQQIMPIVILYADS